MVWVLWLAAPAALTLLVALWVWLRGRPARVPSTAQAVRAHRDFLDALAVPARGTVRRDQ